MINLDVISMTVQFEDGQTKRLQPDEFRLATLLKEARDENGRQLIVAKRAIANILNLTQKKVSSLILRLRRKGCPIHLVNNSGWVWEPLFDDLVIEIGEENLESVQETSARSLHDHAGFLEKHLKKNN